MYGLIFARTVEDTFKLELADVPCVCEITLMVMGIFGEMGLLEMSAATAHALTSMGGGLLVLHGALKFFDGQPQEPSQT